MSDSEKGRLLNTTAPASTYVEEDDGLSSFSLEQLGKKVGTFGGARIMKFNSGTYATTAGEIITANREFYLIGLIKMMQKFVGKKLITSFVVPPHDPLPNLDKMNAEAPQEEWGVSPFNGKPQGPWSYILALKLRDFDILDRYVFVTNSIGGGIAVGDLTDKIKWVRELKGKNVTAVVICEPGVQFKSGYNPQGVLRPSFRIVKYARLIGEENNPTLLSAPEIVTAEPASTEMPSSTEVRPSMQAAEQLDTFAGGSEKKEPKYTFLDLVTPPKPSLKDEMNDELPI